MKVSFIIPLYNGLVLTQAMLASLRATVPAHLTHEIIFVDDGSTDGTRDWLASLPSPCRFLLNEKNLGFAGTCNRGAAAAQGELIFLLNNDLALLPGWLEPMQAALHSSQRPGIVGNIQINAATGVIDHTGIEISSAAKLVHSHWQPRSLSRLMCAQRTVPAVTAACCVLPRETFLREGGFDESFRNGGEDIDLCWRLAQRGYDVVVAFKSVVRHHIRASRGPVSLADEANTQRLFARWRKEIIALGDQCWAKNIIRQFFTNPSSVNGFTVLSALAYRAGWRTRPPRGIALAFDSALHYEELHWQQRLAGTIKPVVYPPSAYTLRGVYHDWSKASNADSVWLRDRAQLTLPAGTPARNFFINGFLLPPSSDQPPAAGQLGLRITINGAQSLDFFPLPTGHFNCGLDRPLVTRDEETKIEITLLGVKRANAFAQLAQRISQWPLPLKWRAWAVAYQSHPLNRRLRLAQIVGDKQPIYDFAYTKTHEIRRRRRVPPATHCLDNRLDRLRFPEISQKPNSRPTDLIERQPPAAPVSKNLKGPLYYEELQWSAASTDSATKNHPASAYTLHGVYRDWTSGVNGDTVWLRDRAKLSLPPGTPAHNFFVNGFLLPQVADEPSSLGPLGLRLTVNDARSIDFYPLPVGHFNCGIDQLIVGTEVATEIEITLLGVENSNDRNRIGASWRSTPPESYHLNQRLRLAQIVDDRHVIYDFKQAQPQQLSRHEQPAPTLVDRLKPKGLNALALQLGWRLRPASTSTLVVDSSIYYEKIPWQQQREEAMSTPANLLTDYSVEGLSRDRRGMEVNADTLWLRDCARVRLPAGTPIRNFYVNGFVLPATLDHAEATGPLGLRLTINGRQSVDFFPLPEDHFNCGIAEPLVFSNQPTEVEITLLGVERSNTLAWLGRLTAKWPLPRRWRQRLEAYRLQRLNQRLRLSQIIGDDEPIYDFKHATPLALARRWRTPPTGVNLVGWFRATLGVGESARCMAQACDAAALPAALIDLRLNCLNPPSVDTFAARLQNANPHPVNIFHVDPPASEEIDHHHGANFRKDKYNIAYWAWELPEFPDHWVKQAAHFHEIWCPSAFVRDAIAAKVSRSVHVMPHAISFPAPAANGRERFKLPTDRFLFLFAYDLNSYQERKNPLAVVAAYRRAFPDERGVGLVIKTQNPERNTEAYARLQAALTGLQHAQIITEALPSADVHLLQAACDAFVSLHRAEGFGLSVAECMYLGKPVISTDWSATAEFVNAHNGCPVKCTLVKLTETHGPYQQGQIWAEPNVEHAAEWMQRLVNEPSLVQTLGQQAAADIRERFAPAVIGASYRRRLEAFALWASEA